MFKFSCFNRRHYDVNKLLPFFSWLVLLSSRLVQVNTCVQTKWTHVILPNYFPAYSATDSYVIRRQLSQHAAWFDERQRHPAATRSTDISRRSGGVAVRSSYQRGWCNYTKGNYERGSDGGEHSDALAARPTERCAKLHVAQFDCRQLTGWSAWLRFLLPELSERNCQRPWRRPTDRPAFADI